DKRQDDIGQALLGTRGNNDILGLVIQVVVALELDTHRLTQVEVTGYRSVMAPVIVDRLFGSLLDVGRSIKIGFSQGKIDHVDALGSQLTAQLGHFEGFRLTEAGKNGG